METKTLKLVKSQNWKKNWRIGHFGKKLKKRHYKWYQRMILAPDGSNKEFDEEIDEVGVENWFARPILKDQVVL